MIYINKYAPLSGSSYIDLPIEIKRKQACVNVKNRDDACFAWAVTSALYPARRNSDRVSSYPHYKNVLNLNGITLPIKRPDIIKFEVLNDMSINVYVLKKISQFIQMFAFAINTK